MSGGGGGGNQNVTQTSEPPSYVAPYLGEAATRAQWELYANDNNGRPYYPGETVVPFANETNQALGGIANRATAGSAVNQAANSFAQRTLGTAPTSQFGGATNPHLDAQFNRAADAVQNRLGTQYASAGRNLSAMRNPQSQELNDLATQMYGGAYESERNRMANDLAQQRQQQVATLGMAPGIANQDYVDLDRLRGVGAEREDLTGRQMEDAAARYDYAQQAPGLALDQYISRLQGMPGSSISTNTPIYRNQVAGGLGGAMAGGNIGSMFSNTSGGNYGGWGAALGGLLGAFGS